MKKALIIFDGNNFPEGAFRFIKELQDKNPVLLTAAVLHRQNFESLLLPATFAVSAVPMEELMEEETLTYSNAKEYFKEQCIKNGIEHTVHEESTEWNIDELIKETRFADFAVISEEIFFPGGGAAEPNGFMQQLLHRAECPVMLFPEGYTSFNEIIIAYDGGKDSVFALKEFIFLFPDVKNMPARIVYAENRKNDHIPDMDYLVEYASGHFESLEIEKLHFNERKFFSTWLAAHPGALIISGSFGTGGFLRLLKMSFAEKLIREHVHPLFIAHR